MNGGYTNGTTTASPLVIDKESAKLANIVRRKLTGYVGFANLPNQWHRKSVRKGFNFNVMVVGISPIPVPCPLSPRRLFCSVYVSGIFLYG